VPARPVEPSFVELFTPKLVTVLREGYGAAELRHDAVAGLTVAIVALPLSMAIAIASGATPAQGLYTSIIGGFLVSALGGSRFQIGGPAGAFIVLVAATVAQHGPAGLILAVFLLVFMLVVAPLAAFIPMAALAGLLATVAWNMFERRAILALLRASRGDAAVLLVTIALTMFRDLTEAIVVGFALGSVLFIHRMSQVTAVASETPFVPQDRADKASGDRTAYRSRAVKDPDIVIYRISGVFFFGAAASIGAVLDRVRDSHRALIVDFSAVPFIDSTAAHTIEDLARSMARRKVKLYLTGTSPELRHDLAASGIEHTRVRFADTIDDAVRAAHDPPRPAKERGE